MNNNQFDMGSIMNTMIMMMVLVMMMKFMTKSMEPARLPLAGGGPIPKGYEPVRYHYPGYSRPLSESERAAWHKKLYGSSELPPRGTGLGEYRSTGKPLTESERAERHEEIYGTSELPPRGTGRLLEEHHSIHGPERENLVDLYGTWAVGRAESVCREGDVWCVEREASKLLAAYRQGSKFSETV